MADMSIPHFGTTLIEQPPPEGVDQASIPMAGDLKRTNEFLTILGAEVYITNMYPGIGRQFIYRKGTTDDVDYFEKDSFTSYVAEPLPDIDRPRAGETVFRLPHSDAVKIATELMEAGLIKPLSSYDSFIKGGTPTLLFIGPDRQQYELCRSGELRHENHRVYIWTALADLDAHKAGYAEHFDVRDAGTEDFYGMGVAHLMVREAPGITIALLTVNDRDVAPKHSFDIFRDAGYSHFRLAAPDKAQVRENAIEAFPDGGGPVAFVHFQNAYLELVQIGDEG